METQHIRKLKRLPDPCESQAHLVSLGFGYQSKSIDYKVVKILRCFPSQLEVVYSSKLDSWRRVGVSFRTNVEFEIIICQSHSLVELCIG